MQEGDWQAGIQTKRKADATETLDQSGLDPLDQPFQFGPDSL
jgi:hypothetical protein